MNCPSFRSAVLASLGACALTAVAPPALLAQTPQLEELSPETGWFLRFGGFIRTGIKLSLRDRAIPAPAFNDPNGGFNYDNGFVKPDNSGSAKDTYNWGYTGAPAESYTAVPQYTAGSDHLTFQRLANAPRIGDVDLGSRSLYGGQMTGGIEVSHFKLAHRDVKWGFEVGYAYSTLSASASARGSSYRRA